MAVRISSGSLAFSRRGSFPGIVKNCSAGSVRVPRLLWNTSEAPSAVRPMAAFDGCGALQAPSAKIVWYRFSPPTAKQMSPPFLRQRYDASR